MMITVIATGFEKKASGNNLGENYVRSSVLAFPENEEQDPVFSSDAEIPEKESTRYRAVWRNSAKSKLDKPSRE